MQQKQEVKIGTHSTIQQYNTTILLSSPFMGSINSSKPILPFSHSPLLLHSLVSLSLSLSLSLSQIYLHFQKIQSFSSFSFTMQTFPPPPPPPLLLLLPLSLFLLSNLLVPVTSNSEGDALYALRRSVKDPNNVLQSWDPTLVDPCTWFHVTCDSANHVTRLDLGNAKLSGNLVPELGNLEHLQYLELYMNELVGPIPKEIGRLKSLISLDLYHNNLTASIPSSLKNLHNLNFLRLNGNKLSGRIPRQLTKLGNLKIIDVSDNDLCGTIPTSGSFSKFSEESFKNNPRLEGPELMGFVRYENGGTC